MGLLQRLPEERWRRLGILNVSLIVSCGLILTIGLISMILSRPGSTIMEARILFRGKCSTSNSLDLFLHFVINIFSTAVLASSNFFMQLVISPTRKEIDHVHRSLHSLEIGVSSFKNLGSLSWFKILAWAGLFLSSVPVHLLFNSAIYSIDYQGSDWHLTIATLNFVDQTVEYFVPGASLAASGSSCPAAPDGSGLVCSYSGDARPTGYGLNVSIQDGYWSESLTRMNITKAAQNSSSWEILTPSDCFDQYRFCKPRQKYRDLIVVIDQVPGWTRAEVYNFNGNAASNLSQFWDSRVPPNRLNSLWFSAPCRLWRDRVISESPYDDYSRLCSSSFDPEQSGCSGALGEPSGLDWINTTKLQGNWKIPFRPSSMDIPPSFGYNYKFNEILVKHCRAEPNPEYICKVGLAPLLLLFVIGCVFIKGIICTGLLFGLTHTSLVTPGDAISSFISQPDLSTAGLGTMGSADADRLGYKSIDTPPVSGLFSGPQARKWKRSSTRFNSVLPAAVWKRTYAVLTCGMALLITGLGLTVTGYGASTLTESFGKSATTTISISFSYLDALLVANTPQLILSLCYFALNSFFTRIQVEEEWRSYSLSYKPLRVSDPKGEQVSNYRLQLPYIYSIPLIGISIVLHWILSNAIFLSIIEGGFWSGNYQARSITDGFGVSENSHVAVGVSGSALLALTIVSTALYLVPVLFSFRKVSGDMVSGGTNSLVLSAACHVPVIARTVKAPLTETTDSTSTRNAARQPTVADADPASGYQREPSVQDADFDSEGSRPLGNSFVVPETEHSATCEQRQETGEDEMRLLSGGVTKDEEMALLEEVAMSKIRWGAMAADPGILECLEPDELVLHLGFGTEDHNVQPPCEGQSYI